MTVNGSERRFAQDDILFDIKEKQGIAKAEIGNLKQDMDDVKSCIKNLDERHRRNHHMNEQNHEAVLRMEKIVEKNMTELSKEVAVLKTFKDKWKYMMLGAVLILTAITQGFKIFWKPIAAFFT